MRRSIALTAAALVIAGGTAALTAANRDTKQAGQTQAMPPATAQIKRQTLQETLDVDGELGYGPTLTATARKPGTVTWLPAAGAEVTPGHPLYRLDNAATVLLSGTVPAYRAMAPGAEGPDVQQLEQNLRALGYQGFTVDDEYTDATADAVERWQEDLGLPETGVVELGRVVFASGTVRVDSLEAEVGQPASPGQRLLTYTGTTKVVTVDLDVADRAVAKPGAAVSVTLPGGKRTPGKVTEVATVIEPGQGNNADPTTRIEALVALDDQQAAADLGLAAVDVTFTAAKRENVLTVPVAALVAMDGGGFGVEVVDGATTRHVPVETGLFAGGRVEITGDGLTEGATVGMPK
ncbi:peptidoglycan-binding protein [Dactylosporangium sp. AC04546]|uniref:efflux RND transporter periplasmic adaptor subunit n=1 Tax=Dactylosporangium sp. AC04546 TaxID=2862460 RepID=UPI001EDE7D97|nr:peptidoglycan-binding protein [Dactylosporangium sp. AC04546]WVK84164.1 peptidoglycan-binding protein [Dactylosporangium sp. AC04546]